MDVEGFFFIAFVAVVAFVLVFLIPNDNEKVIFNITKEKSPSKNEKGEVIKTWLHEEPVYGNVMRPDLKGGFTMKYRVSHYDEIPRYSVLFKDGSEEEFDGKKNVNDIVFIDRPGEVVILLTYLKNKKTSVYDYSGDDYENFYPIFKENQNKEMTYRQFEKLLSKGYGLNE